MVSDLEGYNFKDIYLAALIVLIVMVKECVNGQFGPTLISATQSLSLTVSLEGNPLPPCLGRHTQSMCCERTRCVWFWSEREGEAESRYAVYLYIGAHEDVLQSGCLQEELFHQQVPIIGVKEGAGTQKTQC